MKEKTVNSKLDLALYMATRYNVSFSEGIRIAQLWIDSKVKQADKRIEDMPI